MLRLLCSFIIGLVLVPLAYSAESRILGVQSAAGGALSVPVRGGLATLFATGLDSLPKFSLASAPLPTELAGVQVLVRGTPSPLLAVINAGSVQQINFQMPTEPAGNYCGTAPVSIVLAFGGRIIASSSFNGSDIDAGSLFEISGNGAFFHSDFSLVTSAHPAAAGQTIIILASGLGPTLPVVKDGAPAPLIEPLARFAPKEQCKPAVILYDRYSVWLEDRTGRAFTVEPDFIGLMPGYVGVFQINVALPATIRFAEGPVSVKLWRTHCALFCRVGTGNYYSLPKLLPWSF